METKAAGYKCVHHIDKPSVAFCKYCDRPLCAQCAVQLKDFTRCRDEDDCLNYQANIPEKVIDKLPTIEQNQKQTDRPRKVTIAITLLYATIGIGVLQGLWTIKTRLDALRLMKEGTLVLHRTPLEAKLASLDPTGIGRFIFSIPILVFLWVLYRKIGKGKVWARTTLLVFSILGAPFYLPILLRNLGSAPVMWTLSIINSMLLMVALVFLFQKQSSQWFKATNLRTMKKLDPKWQVVRSGLKSGSVGVMITLVVIFVALFVPLLRGEKSNIPLGGMSMVLLLFAFVSCFPLGAVYRWAKLHQTTPGIAATVATVCFTVPSALVGIGAILFNGSSINKFSSLILPAVVVWLIYYLILFWTHKKNDGSSPKVV